MHGYVDTTRLTLDAKLSNWTRQQSTMLPLYVTVERPTEQLTQTCSTLNAVAMDNTQRAHNGDLPSLRPQRTLVRNN